MKHKASCCCGQLEIVFDGEIKKTTICHCFQCQKRTGSVFGVQTRLSKEQTSISGESSIYRRTGDEGTTISFHFCPHCGSTVYYEAEWLGDFLAVPVGAFADPHLPIPKRDIYRDRKHDWVLLPKEIEEFKGD